MRHEDVIEVEDGGSTSGRASIVVVPKDGKDIADTVRKLATTRKWPVESLVVNQGRLDEVFSEITANSK